jgi:membrane-associated phospholipid phosphatase
VIAEVAARIAGGLRPAQVEERLGGLRIAWFAVTAAGVIWAVCLGDAHGLLQIAESPWVASHRRAIGLFSDWALFPFYALFAAVLILGWRLRLRPLVVAATGYLIAQLSCSVLLVRLLKMSLGHARPSTGGVTETGGPWIGPTLDASFHSFPSGHTADAFTGALFLGLLLPARTLWPVWLAIAVAVGLSRVCLYSHYPTDVVASAFLAGAATLLTARFWMLPRLRRIETEAPTLS